LHVLYARGDLALDVRSQDGRAIASWLGERLPFRTDLPKALSWQRYRLVGARVLPFEDRSLAYVAFEMEGRPISLLIVPAAVVHRQAPAGR